MVRCPMTGSQSRDGRMQYRVIFVAKRSEAVYVLHAFEKKTRKTRRAEIDLARKRLIELDQ